MAMTSRERVLTALRRQEPDRVPYFELGIDRALAQRLMNWGAPLNEARNIEANDFNVEEAKALAEFLHCDNICCVLRAPVYAHKVPGKDGRLFYGEGMIHTVADLAKIQLPDPYDDATYAEAETWVRNKGDYALCLVTRMGIFPTMLGIGTEDFCTALFDNRPFIEKMLDMYCDWTCAMAERACGMGFDIFVTTDDMAFKTAPFFSPKVFHDMVMPRYRRLREKVTLPWVVHSDGNLMPFMDDFLSLGLSGLHPNEKGAMDIRQMKKDYGDRLCLLGNVDLNILGLGTPADVDAEVKGLIRDVAPGGGYIVTSGNSLAGYLKPECVIALAEAVQKYGRYPIRV